MERLMGPDGCPWDKEQTHESIRKNVLEEAYEVAETIDQNDIVHMKEELGDLLLQVLFHFCVFVGCWFLTTCDYKIKHETLLVYKFDRKGTTFFSIMQIKVKKNNIFLFIVAHVLFFWYLCTLI